MDPDKIRLYHSGHFATKKNTTTYEKRVGIAFVDLITSELAYAKVG